MCCFGSLFFVNSSLGRRLRPFRPIKYEHKQWDIKEIKKDLQVREYKTNYPSFFSTLSILYSRLLHKHVKAASTSSASGRSYSFTLTIDFDLTLVKKMVTFFFGKL